MEQKCEKCGYKWESRVEKPRQCPNCKRQINTPALLTKEMARSILREAVEVGDVVRQPCEVCGEKKVQGHHMDYSKPLEVKWLCGKHHRQWHKENGFLKGFNSTYKMICLPEKLHKEIKLRAVKKGVSIIEYLEELVLGGSKPRK